MARPTIEKYAGIVDGLYKKTLKGEINWADPKNGSYSCLLGSSIIVIRPEVRNGQTRDIYIYIHNDSGDLIDKFSDVDITDMTPAFEGFSDYFGLMDELLRRAGREATGAEKVLDSILSQLEK